MARLVQFPKTRVVSNALRSLPGAKAWLYEAGTTTPLVTYSDAALSAAQTHPVVADAYGTFGPIYLADSVAAYKIRLTNNAGSEIWTEDNVPVGSGGGGGTVSGEITYPLTDDEDSAGVTPLDYGYPQGDIRRYGATDDPAGTGVEAANNTAITDALRVAEVRGTKVYIPATATEWKVSDEFTIPAKVTVCGDGYSSLIRQYAAEKNVFILGNDTMVCRVYLRGTAAVTGSTFTKFNGVYGEGVRNVVIDKIYASHWWASSIQLRSCTNYKITDNISFQNSVDVNPSSSQSDILIYSLTAGSRGIISRNGCYSNQRAAGIFVNAIGYDYDMTITDNVVVTLNDQWAEMAQASVARRHGIMASYQSNGSTGGRTVISGNVVSNCATTGIYRASGVDPGYPVIISDNFITNVGWYVTDPSLAGGIYVLNGGAGDKVCDNTVAYFRGIGSRGSGGCIVSNTYSTTNVGHVSIEGNRCINSLTHGINLSGDIRNHQVINNTITQCTLDSIYIIYTPAHPNSTGNVVVRGNTITRSHAANTNLYPGVFLYSSAAAPTYILDNFIQGHDGAQTGVNWFNSGVYAQLSTGTMYVRHNTISTFYHGVYATGCPSGRGSLPNVVRNQINSCARGVALIATSAADTIACVGNSFRDLGTNVTDQARNVGYTNGAAYHFTASNYPQAAADGTWELGDTCWNTSPQAGTSNPIGWVCVTGGAPGTWAAFGIIA